MATHEHLNTELNMPLANDAMYAHAQTALDHGDAEAIRAATAAIVGATCFLEQKIGRGRTVKTIRELLAAI